MTDKPFKKFKFGDKVCFMSRNGQITNAIVVRGNKVFIESNSRGDYAFYPMSPLIRGWKHG